MIFTTHTLSVCCSLAFSLAACGNPDQPLRPLDRGVYQFDFRNADAVIDLPGRLEEISGLTLVDDSLVASVQDEKGEIYVININSGEVVDEFKFAKSGDFEGIELVDDTMYVLRSDGAIYVVSDWRSKGRQTEKIETELRASSDTEGLGYQQSHHRLLVAAKEFAGRSEKRVRSIHAFDLRTKILDPEPAYRIPLDSIGVALGIPGESIRTLLAPVLDLEGFKPSALAVHPSSGDIFVISSVLKVIAVLSPDGKLTDLFPVEVDGLPQPEGLAFLPNGDLLISTEGRGGDGRILRFNTRQGSE